jgi:hypothetical protein
MERDPELEEHLDQEALKQFGPEAVQVMRQNREDAHAGDYREAIAAHCQGRSTEPRSLTQEEKTEVVLDTIEEHPRLFQTEDEDAAATPSYKHAENAYQNLKQARRELGEANRPGLTSQVETAIKGLFMDGADQ